MRTRRLLLGSIAAAVVAAGSFLIASPAVAGGGGITTDRIAGTDRYDTSVKLSQSEYTVHADVVFIATGVNYPDALAAGDVAAHVGGPLLLTDPSSLPTVVKNELVRLNPATVVIVGGTSAVSDHVVSQIHSALPLVTPTRVSGSDRYDTARKIVNYGYDPGSSNVAYIATGMNYPDALSASADGGASDYPLLLVNGSASTLDAATSNELQALGVSRVAVIGGTSAVSAGIKTALASVPGIVTVDRLAGSDRFGTSVKVAQDNFNSAAHAYLATGLGFPDALAGSAIAAVLQAPLFTVQSNCVPQVVLDELQTLGVTHVTLIGGTNTLTAGVASLTSCTPATS